MMCITPSGLALADRPRRAPRLVWRRLALHPPGRSSPLAGIKRRRFSVSSLHDRCHISAKLEVCVGEKDSELLDLYQSRGKLSSYDTRN